jgi:hypothetical protein
MESVPVIARSGDQMAQQALRNVLHVNRTTDMRPKVYTSGSLTYQVPHRELTG